MDDRQAVDGARVAALADGQLQGAEFGQALDYLGASAQARAQWDTYRIVGDVLRGELTALRCHDEAFVQRLRLRLTPDAPALRATDHIGSSIQLAPGSVRRSANDGWWKRVAGLASIAMVSVIGWQSARHFSADSPGPATGAAQMAQATVLPTVPTGVTADTGMTNLALEPQLAGNDAVFMATQPVLLRDARLDALLAAHRQFATQSTLPMPSGFLRNATFQGSTP